ncbi:MAG TPA: thiol reductant ABC exporter subunit CydD [Acidimicrobiales bacterium]
MGDRRVAALLAASVGSGVASVLCTIAWLVLLASVIDDVFLHGDQLSSVSTRLAWMVGLLAVRALLAWTTEVLADRASGILRTGVRAQLVDHLFAVGPAGLALERTGEVAATIGTGVEALHEYTTRFVPAAALGIAGPAIVFVAIAVLDPWTTLILAFTGPMLVLLLAVIGRRTRALTQRRFDELGWLSAFYLDMVRGLATLKAFGRSADGADTIEDVSRRFGDTTMEVLRTAFQTSLVMEWAATAATALAAVEVSFRLVGGDLTFGTALVVLVLIPEFFVPFRRLAMEYHAGQSGRAALERIDELTALPAMAPVPAPDHGGITEALGSQAPSIELVDLGYRYPGAPVPALDGLDLRIAAGESVALVGPSGAGKTTVTRLLLRFIEPDRGSVLVDGRPLESYDVGAWRRSMAWVPQAPTIIAGTVADNIRLGDPDASDDRVRAAAEAARASGFIEQLPAGFDTELGEQGLRLSGGQRQRLAIARAALRDAPVVVLDEFTAHLDDRTEAELLDAIATLLSGRTAIVIAHRTTTAAMCDRIVRLDRGRLAEPDPLEAR